jgi:hypothetical protein
VLCTTQPKTLDQGFRKFIKNNCCKLLGVFSADQYESASSAIKLLSKAIFLLYVSISQGKKVLNEEPGNVATKKICQLFEGQGQ